MLKGVLLNVCSTDHIPELDYMEWALEIICFVIRCIAISKKTAQNNTLRWIKHLNDPKTQYKRLTAFIHVHSPPSVVMFIHLPPQNFPHLLRCFCKPTVLCINLIGT